MFKNRQKILHAPIGARQMSNISSESLTILGQSYTIQEIYERYTQGIMPIVRTGTFDNIDDIDSPDFSSSEFDQLDISEKFHEVDRFTEEFNKRNQDDAGIQVDKKEEALETKEDVPPVV